MVARRCLVRYGRRDSPLTRLAFTCITKATNTFATTTTEYSRRSSGASSFTQPGGRLIHCLHAPGLDYNDDLFNFTRGRFVRNEAHEMSQRHIRFNVEELARLAAEAVGAKSCVRIKKYPDGMYNKTMLLTMEDGTQVVAKVPNPNAGQPHFTTASEVATMEFVSMAGC